METNIVYFDETGDDGIVNKSSDDFILTSVYLNSNNWNENFNRIKEFRKGLKDNYGFYTNEEMHTKNFLTDKEPYRKYEWNEKQKREILIYFTKMIASLNIKCVNVIIDKNKVTTASYNILEKALTYNIQRIENDSNGNWNYIIITDKGRIAPMRKTARKIRAFNPIHSKYSFDYTNQPIKGLIEDVLEKESEESYFIQICDFISYFVHLYYKNVYQNKKLPNRVEKLIDIKFVKRVLETLKAGNILNLKASTNNEYGIVIYPK